jgi:hypothetical protein
MTDFIDDLIAGDAPISRTIAFTTPDGETKSGTVYFKRITAGQRQKLLAGQKFSVNRSGQDSNVLTEIDLALNERQKHQLVAFSVCRADGKAVFSGPDEVAKVDALKVGALYDAASEINAERDAGKA